MKTTLQNLIYLQKVFTELADLQDDLEKAKKSLTDKDIDYEGLYDKIEELDGFAFKLSCKVHRDAQEMAKKLKLNYHLSKSSRN